MCSGILLPNVALCGDAASTRDAASCGFLAANRLWRLSNNRLELTRSATAKVARPSQLKRVLGRPDKELDVKWSGVKDKQP